MVQIKINHTSYEDVTRDGNPNDVWDRDDTCAVHSFDGFRIIKHKNGYYDFKVEDFDKTKPYYLVYVLYDTGDSFGRDDNRCEFIHFTESKKDATTICKAITKDAVNGSYNAICIGLENGESISIGVSTWKGYFEKFNSAEVETLKLNDYH